MINWLITLFLYVARNLLYLLVRTTVLPEDLKQLQLDPDKPVCYVLQTRFFSNLLVMEAETRKAGLPRAMRFIQSPHLHENRSVFFLTRSDNASLLQPNRFAYSPRFIRLVEAVRANPQLDVQLVPVTILWGREPRKQDSVLKALFAETWQSVSTLRHLLAILIHGRHTVVRFNAPISLRDLLSGDIEERRVARVLAEKGEGKELVMLVTLEEKPRW